MFSARQSIPFKALRPKSALWYRRHHGTLITFELLMRTRVKDFYFAACTGTPPASIKLAHSHKKREKKAPPRNNPTPFHRERTIRKPVPPYPEHLSVVVLAKERLHHALLVDTPPPHLLAHPPVHSHCSDVVVVQDSGEVVRVANVRAECDPPAPLKAKDNFSPFQRQSSKAGRTNSLVSRPGLGGCRENDPFFMRGMATNSSKQQNENHTSRTLFQRRTWDFYHPPATPRPHRTPASHELRPRYARRC